EAADAAAARWPGVVNPKRGGYQGGAAEYVRLDTAARIDAASASESASWGAFQIMAYHWKRLGYASDDEFESRMELG
ncbi:N-acetylmuramidase domain-containing protein, partial [Burkholderia pseudomallei]